MDSARSVSLAGMDAKLLLINLMLLMVLISADWWSARQIHHIRPRIYGGTDDFNNLLPVPNANHYLITSWF